MIGLEFRLKLSSAYSIRVPYSYQCARTYPLPAPSTIKGLCANALWRLQGGDPVQILNDINKSSIIATSRTVYQIAITSCTVRVVPMDALLRQFAFTPYIDCMIVFKDNVKALVRQIEEYLKISPVYLGDSESLACITPESVNSEVKFDSVSKDKDVEVNALVKFNVVRNNSEKGVVLYMQDDSCSPEAILHRYIAPLRQKGDSYEPLESLSFTTSKDCIIVEGNLIKGLFCEVQDEAIEDKQRSRKKKA
jgi:CRISPR-associated Cas5-like protein